jgi:type II secretory pathway pseudopilin PulG
MSALPLRRSARRTAPPRRPRPGRRAGFTAIEVLLAIAAATLLSGLVFNLVVQGNAVAARIRSEQRLAAMRDALEAFYRDHAFAIEAAPAGVLALGGAVVVRSGATLDAAAAAPLRAYLLATAEEAIRDGYGRPFRIEVSDTQHPIIDGAQLCVRRIAIVSAGPNGRFDSGAWDAANGILALAGDDLAAYVDGAVVQRPQLAETLRRMARISTLVRGIASTRFLASAARDITIDYFGAGPVAAGWDPGALLLRSADRPLGPAGRFTDGELSAIGVSRLEATDAWGGDLSFDNDSSVVRQPGNPVPGRDTPPWSARLVAQLPGGGNLVESIDGVF